MLEKVNMSFSYSGITNYGKATLPSVEAGLGSINIIKDPPKSIMTRKITKVGENSSLTQMIENSGDRSCEAINVYARGVNPFVSVSYQNYGNNGGQSKGGNSSMYGGRQAYLPYNFKNGSFRPPMLTQKQLVPLSRQPRTSTSMICKPGMVDYSKKIYDQPTHEDDVKGVKKNVIKSSVRPTMVYNVHTEQPRSENLEDLNAVKKNVIKTSARPTMVYNIHIPQTQQSGTYHNVKDIKTIQASTNTGTSRITVNKPVNICTKDYTQDILTTDVTSNIRKNVHVTPIDMINDNHVRVKDTVTMSHTPNMVGYTTKDNIITNQVELEKNIPVYTARTNTNRNIHVRSENENELSLTSNRPVTQVMYSYGTQYTGKVDNITKRDVDLPERTKRGGFEPRGNKPTMERISTVPKDIDSEKTRMNKKIMNQMLSRNNF